jgi:hypothetical protein
MCKKMWADKLVTFGDGIFTGLTGNSFFANLSVNEGARSINDCIRNDNECLKEHKHMHGMN